MRKTFLKLFVRSDDFTQDYAFVGVDDTTPDKRHVITNMSVETIDADANIPGPFLRISQKEVQFLFNELWQQGFRPEKYQEADGELKATKYHLEDMRKLVKLK